MPINPVQKPTATVTPVLVSWEETDSFAAKTAGENATDSIIRSAWRGSLAADHGKDN